MSYEKRRLAWLRLVLAGAILASAESLSIPAPAPHETDVDAREALRLEYEVKAAFLYNFAKFVEWPSGPEGEHASLFTIGVLGPDPFGQTLDRTIQGKSVGGKTLAVARYRDVREVRQCEILFVGAADADRSRAILAELKGRPILTVGEAEEFTREGGVIRLLVADERVHFEINLDAARHAGLKISSKLLAVASVMRETGAREPNP